MDKRKEDMQKKMQCVHGTNLDTLLSVMLKTDGYLLPYSKLFKLGKKELTTGENKIGTLMGKVVCTTLLSNAESTLEYAIGASTKFPEKTVDTETNDIIKNLHKTPVICYGNGTRYQGVGSVLAERRFREVKVEFIAVHDKHYEYVKTVLDGLGVNLPVVPLNFQASEQEIQDTFAKYKKLKAAAEQCDKQREIKKWKNTQLDYTHLPSNDNENLLFDKPAKHSTAVKNQQAKVSVSQNASTCIIQ